MLRQGLVLTCLGCKHLQDGSGYVVTSVVVQFKLKQGKYVREHNK